MPELAEVKIAGEFINYIANKEIFFNSIEKSDVSKVKTDFNILNEGIFKIEAKSRGKEMLIFINLVGNEVNKIKKKLLVTLGMSGNFMYVSQDSAHFEKIMKHAHLRFKSVRGNYLVLYDIRRFAKWKWVEGWSQNRGNCPLTEFNEFSEKIRFYWKNHKVFSTPLNEILMNQSIFNGIGNYLRSEIIYRLDVNPFQPANNLSNEELDKLIKICYTCCQDAYYLGGGQLKDWQNPNGTEGKNFNEWIKCYGNKNMSKIKDKTGRTFWFNPKWETFCV